MDEDQNILEENPEKENHTLEEVNENISPEQTIEQTATNPTSEINKSEIENMEVHHHPNLNHRKKHWKEYLLEFLMIFLAVTLGFFAENIRENITEHHRGNQYIASELADVKLDSANVSKLIKEYEDQQTRLDSLLNYFYEINQPGLSQVFIRNEAFMGFGEFVYTDRTMQQLKNAGGLRMIEDASTEDSIADYDQFVRLVIRQSTPLTDYSYKCVQCYVGIFNLPEINKAVNQNGIASDTVKKDFLLTHDKKELATFYGYIWVFKAYCNSYLSWLNDLKQKADNLIAFLQKKYNLQ